MLYIGDCHGVCRPQYLAMIKSIAPKKSIHVGDLALGYPGVPDLESVEGARFIRGNHDNPQACQQHPNFLGDFGYWEEEGIFFISGAKSIDWDQRTPGYNCWVGEELNTRQWHDCIELYAKVKPEKVVSHDCPVFLVRRFWDFEGLSGTTYGLQALFDNHKPKTWVFGHHHKSRAETIKGTTFICLGCQFVETFNANGESTGWTQVGFDVVEL